ncbi:MAG: helix-turn-helix domain-containing protein [Phycisphaerales bacterium]
MTATATLKPMFTAAQIKSAVCRTFDVRDVSLPARRRTRSRAESSAVAVYMLRTLCAMPFRDIADELRYASPSGPINAFQTMISRIRFGGGRGRGANAGNRDLRAGLDRAVAHLHGYQPQLRAAPTNARAIPTRPPRRPTPHEVLVCVCAATRAGGVAGGDGLSESDVMSSARSRPLCRARAVYAALCRRHTDHSFPEIAAAMSRPTGHSTIVFAAQRFAREAARDPELRQLAHRAESLLVACP